MFGVAPLEGAGSVGPEQLPPARRVPGTLRQGGRVSAFPSLSSETPGPTVPLRCSRHGCGPVRWRRVGSEHGPSEGDVQGVGVAGETRGAEQLLRSDDCHRSQGVRLGAADMFGDPTIVLAPAGLQRDAVLLEVVQHVGDGVEEQVLDAAASLVQHNAEVLQEEETAAVRA